MPGAPTKRKRLETQELVQQVNHQELQRLFNDTLLFKQLKQNFPLKYFLGDNENAIKIQIWCCLLINLLVTIIKIKAKNKKQSFASKIITWFCN